VVESKSGTNSRPMLPEADVMRMDLGGIAFVVMWFLDLVGYCADTDLLRRR
jgi:hypothetical protein